MWEKKFPGYTDDAIEIFGTDHPTIQQVAIWKSSWVEHTNNVVNVYDNPLDLINLPGTKGKILTLCHDLNIHPYFWDFWKDKKPIDIEYKCSFYNPEHLIMFKLAWGLT